MVLKKVILSFISSIISEIRTFLMDKDYCEFVIDYHKSILKKRMTHLSNVYFIDIFNSEINLILIKSDAYNIKMEGDLEFENKVTPHLKKGEFLCVKLKKYGKSNLVIYYEDSKNNKYKQEIEIDTSCDGRGFIKFDKEPLAVITKRSWNFIRSLVSKYVK